jgi:hypothetical protein
MRNSSVESQPDVSLLGVGGWFLFLWGVSHVFPSAWRAPSSFDGWFSFVLSLASWVVGGLATIAIVMMFLTEERKPLVIMPLELCAVMAGWGLVFVGLVILHVVYRETSIGVDHVSTMTAEHSAGPAEPSLNSRVETLRNQHERICALIVELEGERSTLVAKLRETSDMKGNAQVFGNEILEIDRSLKQLKCEAEDVALTVAKGESLLRKTDRQKRLLETGVDLKELNELAALRVAIEERLRSSSLPRSAGEAIQVDRVIREAVGGNR